MYKVLIVDDEPWIVYGIKMLVDWESLGYTVVAEAYNGLAALEEIKDKKPDVIITDIRMPGLNGIELMEEINHQQIDTKVILVSGYAEFEYAQKAIQLGAFDYLLKQIEKDSLVDMLVRLNGVLTEKHQISNKRTLFLENLFEILKPDNKMSVSNFVTNRGLKHEYPNYRFISFSYSQTVVPINEEEIVQHEGIEYLCLRTGQNEISALINYDQYSNPNIIQHIISTVFCNAEYVGVSSIGFKETPISKLFQESDIALHSALFLEHNRIVEYKVSELAMMLPKVMLNIDVAIREQKQERINVILDEFGNACKTQDFLIDQISMFYNQIVAIYQKYYPDHNKMGEVECLGYYQIVSYYNSIDHLIEMIKSFSEKKNGEDIYISNEMVKKILNFIDESFTEDILLSFISKKFNISIGYLSALIKRETGKTYTEYLTNKRLSLAKELIKDETLSIEEVVKRVGYKDYFYFNKLFKKYVGITPSKYRKVSK